jgi:hypothetical protein
MTNELDPELRARYLAGDPAAIREVIDLLRERNHNLLERLRAGDD